MPFWSTTSAVEGLNANKGKGSSCDSKSNFFPGIPDVSAQPSAADVPYHVIVTVWPYEDESFRGVFFGCVPIVDVEGSLYGVRAWR